MPEVQSGLLDGSEPYADAAAALIVGNAKAAAQVARDHIGAAYRAGWENGYRAALEDRCRPNSAP